jgi:hypothetical protein
MDHSYTVAELNNFLTVGGTPVAISRSQVCGCFQCGQTFSRDKVVFSDHRPHCPFCKWRAIVGDSVMMGNGRSFRDLIDQGDSYFKPYFEEEAAYHREIDEMEEQRNMASGCGMVSLSPEAAQVAS